MTVAALKGKYNQLVNGYRLRVGILCALSKRTNHLTFDKVTSSVGEDGVNWPVGLSGRPHLCGN